MDAILEVEGLKTHFITKEETVQAVNGVTFSVGEGETFALVGESGCGKSATCRSILRLIHKPGRIVEGSIRYKGINLLELPEKEIRKMRGSEIGMIFQEPMTALNPVLRIREQIYESLDNKGLSKRQKEERALELLRLVGIPMPEQRLDEYAHQFSGGMRQRAMIAIALAASPKILLADEPTTALDVTIQDQIIKLLGSLKQQLGMSIVLITHDLGVVAQMCDRVAVMYAGYIMETTDTLSLFTAPRHPYTIGLLESLPTGLEKGTRLEPIQGLPPDLGHLKPGCPFAPRCRFREDICRIEMPDMVEIAPGHQARCHCLSKTDGVAGPVAPRGEVKA